MRKPTKEQIEREYDAMDPASREEILNIVLDELFPWSKKEEDEFVQALLKEHEEWEKQQAKAAKKKTTGRKKRTKKDKSAEQLSLDLDRPSEDEESGRRRTRRKLRDDSLSEEGEGRRRTRRLTSNQPTETSTTETAKPSEEESGRRRTRRLTSNQPTEELTTEAVQSSEGTILREGRRKLRDTSSTSSSRVERFQLIDPTQGRRRRRTGYESEREVKPKIIPNPMPEKAEEIGKLAQEIAKQTAKQFLDCIPPDMKEILSDEQLKYQQYELSVGIAEALKSKLNWALNQAWLDAKSNNQRFNSY